MGEQTEWELAALRPDALSWSVHAVEEKRLLTCGEMKERWVSDWTKAPPRHTHRFASFDFAQDRLSSNLSVALPAKRVCAGHFPQYIRNPAHDPRSPLWDHRKTPIPPDAHFGYLHAVPRRDGRVWYWRNPATGHYYRYFNSGDGTAHFSGIVPRNEVPSEVRARWGE